MTIEVGEAPGLIMLGGPSPLLGGVNVRLYGPFWELHKAIASDQVTFEASVRAFDEALESPWSVLGLLSQACYGWLKEPQCAERLLQKMIGYWDEFDVVGRRYTIGGQVGKALWDLPHLLKFVLARRGVAQTRLVQPLPPGGIAALLAARN